jgi:hypothetical protein
MAGLHVLGRLRRGWRGRAGRHAQMEQHARGFKAQLVQQMLEQREGFGLELVERVALGIAAQADHRAQGVELLQVLAPVLVDGLQQDLLFDPAHQFRADIGGLFGIGFVAAFIRRSRISSSAMPSSAAQSLTGRSRLKCLVTASSSPSTSHWSA